MQLCRKGFGEGEAVDLGIVTDVHGEGPVEEEGLDITGDRVGLCEFKEFVAEGFLIIS